VGEVDTDEAAPSGVLSRLKWLPGLAMIGALAWLVVTHVAEEREIARLLEESRPLWLLVAALLQLGTYVTAAEAIRVPLAYAGDPPPRRRLLRLAILKLTMDQLIPTAGMSGTLLVLRRLRALGVPAPVVGSTFVIEGVAYYFAYAFAVLLASAMLWVRHDLSQLIALVATIFAVLATAIPLGMLAFVLRRGRLVPAWALRFASVRALVHETTEVSRPLLVRRRVYVLSALASLGTFALDGLTFGVTLLAVGAEPIFFAGFTALVIGSVAATVGIVPGGVGTFEAAAVGTLVVLGLGSVEALAATLLLRAFTFWLPMLVGVVIYQGDRRRPT
jgi:uncharacterized protein (TIRG00374 family)